MASVEPKDARACARPRAAGFTLIEILLTLGVLALVLALVAPALGSALHSLDRADPGELLWDAFTAARERALTGPRPVALVHDRANRRLAWGPDAADGRAWPEDATLRFLPAQQGATVLLGGRLVETAPLAEIRFYPDGTCDACRVEVSRPGEAPRVLAIDPWTCAPALDDGGAR